MGKKIISKQEFAKKHADTRQSLDGIRGLAKFLGRHLVIMPVILAERTWNRLLNPKTFEPVFYAPKDIVEWHINKSKGPVSIKTAGKIATHFDSAYLEKSYKKWFNSFAAHKAFDMGVESCRDYAGSNDLMLIPYKTRGGSKGPGN